MVKTNAQKQADYRKRKSIRGMKLVQVWVPAAKETALRKYAATLS
jgi:hypothetical protein